MLSMGQLLRVCRLHAAQEDSFCSVELRKYPCSDVQVKVSQGLLTKSRVCVTSAGPSLQCVPAYVDSGSCLCTNNKSFMLPLKPVTASGSCSPAMCASCIHDTQGICRVQVTFADTASTAASIAFAHGASPGRWEKLGGMPLRSHGSSCLQHVVKLGAHTQVQRYLRITLHGLLHPPRGSSFHGGCGFLGCLGDSGV